MAQSRGKTGRVKTLRCRRVVAALRKNLRAPLGPLEVEVKAFDEGLIFANDVGV